MVLFVVVVIFFVIIIIIIIVKVYISRNLAPELELRRRRLLDQLQENTWLGSISKNKNTIIAFGFIFWKTKIMK